MALGHGIRVHLVRAPAELERYGGIGALLLREEPPRAQTMETAREEERMEAGVMRDEPLSPVDTACLRIEHRTSPIVNVGSWCSPSPSPSIA
jgi:hypothetical protein